MAVVGSGLLARSIAASLGTPSLSAWFSACVTALQLIAILPISQAADFWGRKVCILGATLSGVIGSIIISRSENFATAIAGFVLAGAALGCQAVCFTVPSEVLHRKHRAFGQAAANVISGVGGIVGVVVAAQLTRKPNEDWRIYWYICAALFALGFVGVFFGYNPPKRELEIELSLSQKLKRMDWIGAFLIASSLVLLVVALQWSNNPYPWSNAHIIGPFVCSIVLLVAFGVWEWKGTSEGIMHHRLFGRRNFPLSIVVLFLEGLAFFTVVNFFAFEVGFLHHIETFDAAMRVLVLFVASISTSFLVGAYTTWSKQVREPLVVGFSLVMVYCILMVFYHEDLPLANSYGYATIGGAGIGFILTTAIVAAHMGTPADMISLSSGLPSASKALGAAVGIAINQAIFSRGLKSHIPAEIAHAVLPLGFNPRNLGQLIGALASQNQAAVARIPGITPRIIGAAVHGLTVAYRLSFRNLWIAAACFSAVGVIGKFLNLHIPTS